MFNKLKKSLLLLIPFVSILTHQGDALIFRKSVYYLQSQDGKQAEVIIYHDHHKLGSTEENHEQMNFFIDGLQQSASPLPTLIIESIFFYDKNLHAMTISEEDDHLMKAMNHVNDLVSTYLGKKIPPHYPRQDPQQTTFIAWELPLTCCPKKIPFETVDPRILIDIAQACCSNNNKEGTFAALKDLLRSADNVLQSSPISPQKSLTQRTYQGLWDSYNKCQQFINQQECSFPLFHKLITQKYHKHFNFFEPIVSLQIIETISQLIGKDCKKICVFCGAKHALLLDKLLNEKFIFTKESNTFGPQIKDADKEDVSSLKKLLDSTIE